MTNTLIISETKLRMFTSLNDNVDTELLRTGVVVAQDIELQRILGTKLYKKILSDIDSSSLTGNYKTLVDDYVQNSLLYWAYYYVLEDIMVRPRNNGLLIPTGGENSQQVDKTFYDRQRQSAKNKAEAYSERLTNYLIENQAQFPELTQSTKLYENVADFGLQYQSPIVFASSGYYAHLKGAVNAGIPIADSRYPYLPPPTIKTRTIK